ncbi:PadR family transcriptional regulator [Cryobacterium sp. MLB-32]|uniref:PadR family transcriptional regulator n=1 Tax=Cryobacterium sp. MLB-32 TaxID=1529318 RepID=UPI0009DEE79A
MKPLSRVTAATVDVLSVLVNGEGAIWGLRVVKESGRPPGSIYPILDRLETRGWIESEWEADDSRSGPRRRFYKFTPDGRAAALNTLAESARRTSQAPSQLIPSRLTPSPVVKSWAPAGAGT